MRRTIIIIAIAFAARSVCYFFLEEGLRFVVVVDSFAAAKGVALTTRLDRRRQSPPSFRARARTRFERKKDPLPPAVAASRARLVIDASLKPLRLLSLRALCTPGDGDRETERTKSAFFQIHETKTD